MGISTSCVVKDFHARSSMLGGDIDWRCVWPRKKLSLLKSHARRIM